MIIRRYNLVPLSQTRFLDHPEVLCLNRLSNLILADSKAAIWTGILLVSFASHDM